MSPSEPRRTSRKRGISHRLAGADAREDRASSVLRVADDRHADAEQRREFAFGHRFGGVVGSLGVDVRLKLAQQRIHVQIVEDDYVIHGASAATRPPARVR